MKYLQMHCVNWCLINVWSAFCQVCQIFVKFMANVLFKFKYVNFIVVFSGIKFWEHLFYIRLFFTLSGDLCLY